MYDELKSGDLIFVSGRGPVSWGVELATLSLPNIGPLGRWGLAGMSHVAMVCRVFGKPIIYESTSFSRPPCLRSGRKAPKGVQAHHVSDMFTGKDSVWHLPLCRSLYEDEEDRLLAYLEFMLGQPYDFIGAAKSGGGKIMRFLQRFIDKEDMGQVFCSELAVAALKQVGLMQHKNAGAWSPQRLYRYALRSGLCSRGDRLY